MNNEDDDLSFKEALILVKGFFSFIIDWLICAFFFMNLLCIGISAREPTMKEVLFTIASGILMIWRDK